jgi:hypothetical protein
MRKSGSGFEKGRRLQYRKTCRRMAAHRIRPAGPWSQVAEMQAKLCGWAAADLGHRFDDLVNFVHDPATLYVVYCRVEGQPGPEHARRGRHDRAAGRAAHRCPGVPG